MKDEKRRYEDTVVRLETRDNILNSLKIAIYVTDLATNEIIYVNTALQRMHGDRPLTGRICWEALQNKTERCDFCPLPYLLKYSGRSYQRETYNGSSLKIYSSIIPWANGKLVHLHYTVDTT